MLVHLSHEGGQAFFRQLLEALPPRLADRPGAGRLLFACRTQYFRDLHHEADLFTGGQKEGIPDAGSAAGGKEAPSRACFELLRVLPFSEEQIRGYLAGNVPGIDVDRAFEVIEAVHNLRELAGQPYLLYLMRESLVEYDADLAAGRRFAHTSLLEYFLACHLVEALEEGRAEEWELPRPSRETFAFLVERVDIRREANPAAGRRIEATLSLLLSEARPGRSENALDGYLSLRAAGGSDFAPERIDGRGLDLVGWEFTGTPERPPPLTGVDFSGAVLIRATFRHANLAGASFAGADLCSAEFLGCGLSRADFSASRMEGVRMRDCRLSGSQAEGADLRGLRISFGTQKQESRSIQARATKVISNYQ